jgi:apolipoprotein N-acyltransferase
LYMFQHKRWLVSAFGVVLIWLSGWGLQQVQWTEPKGKAVDIALLQGNIPQEKKWLASEFYASMQTYINLTKQNLGADLIVWPETAVPAYFDVVEKGALKSFLEDVQLLDKDVVVGVIDGGVNSVNYYNAIINLNHPDEQRYYKRHLVPFSEYFPFDSVFASLAGLFDIPYATFSEGPEQQALFEIGDNKVSVSVCYEMSFGEELADFLPEAHYLVTVSNDAWFAHTLQPAQQLQEVQMRALELGREIARSTNTGLTAIVAKDGQIKQVIPAYEEGVLVGQIQPYQGATFYALWQRWPITLFVGMVIGLAVLRRRDANKSLFFHRGSKS